MSEWTLTPQQWAVLAAINEGRAPRDEAFLAKLRRKGLITKSVLDKDRWYLTPEGRRRLLEGA